MRRLFLLLLINAGLAGCAVLGGGGQAPSPEQDLATLHDRQERMQAEFDQRMASMEMSLLRQERFLRDYFDVPGAVVVDPEPRGPEPGLNDALATEEPGKSDEPPVPDQPTSTDSPAVSTTAKTPPQQATPEPKSTTTPADPDQVFYDHALQKYYSGEYEQAGNDFSAFADRFPDSSLQPNALYWLAETHYARKEYAQAILVFKELTRRFPASHKTPDALLKAGYAYEHLGDIPNARFHLQIVLDDYPKAAAAKLAREKLGALSGA